MRVVLFTNIARDVVECYICSNHTRRSRVWLLSIILPYMGIWLSFYTISQNLKKDQFINLSSVKCILETTSSFVNIQNIMYKTVKYKLELPNAAKILIYKNIQSRLAIMYIVHCTHNAMHTLWVCVIWIGWRTELRQRAKLLQNIN